MKKILLLLAFFSTSVMGQILPPSVCPTPANINIDTFSYVNVSKISISCKDKNAIFWAKNHLDEWYGKYAPSVKKISSTNNVKDKEGYTLSIQDKGVKIEASTIQGVRYGLYTLRQLAIPKRGTMTVEGWIAPKTEIEDAPAMGFRGIHICWFPETKPYEIERLIRMAAYYKMNYVVLEPWGTFRSKVAPWYGWPDGSMTTDEIHRLCSIAKDLGTTLIPQLNIFGHASMSRGSGGKHAALDFNPAYQPLFEPSAGWNWCLSNPNTKSLISSLIVELLEAFENPPYFHIGCDEADPPSCPECIKRPYSELYIEHVSAMEKVISSHGAKAMMWHDMLLDKNDNRWNGFVHDGTKETAGAIKSMPHDIIICDWYYGGKMDAYPTFDYFKNEGFNVLVCPWMSKDGTESLGEQVKQKQLFGMLGTLWHHYYGSDQVHIYLTTANSEWGNKEVSTNNDYYTHLRQIGWDMKVDKYTNTGIYDYQLPNIPTRID